MLRIYLDTPLYSQLLAEPFPSTLVEAKRLLKPSLSQDGEVSLSAIDDFDLGLETEPTPAEICLGRWSFKISNGIAIPYLVESTAPVDWSLDDSRSAVQSLLAATKSGPRTADIRVIGSEETNDVVFWFDEAMPFRMTHIVYCPTSHILEVIAAVRSFGFSICRWSTDPAVNS